MEFKAGDRVKYVGEEFDKGSLGTICDNEIAHRVGVRWDKEVSYLHTCDGSCDNNHGWYVDISEIVKCDDRAWKRKCKEADKICYGVKS